MIMLKSTHDKIIELKDEQISFLKADCKWVESLPYAKELILYK